MDIQKGSGAKDDSFTLFILNPPISLAALNTHSFRMDSRFDLPKKNSFAYPNVYPPTPFGGGIMSNTVTS